MKLAQLGKVIGSSATKVVRRGGMPEGDLPELTRKVSDSSELRDEIAGVFGAASEEGEAGEWLSPALLHALCFPVSLELLADPRLPVQPLGTVVTSQAWSLDAPVGPGELMLRARVAAVGRDQSGATVTIECTLSREGIDCYTECTNYLDKSGKGELAAAGAESELARSVPHLREEFGVGRSGRLDIGQRHALAVGRFGPKISKKWAHATGDINPIHVSKVSARAFGYRSVILHGAAVDAWAARELGLTGAEPCRGSAAFRAPVLLPAALEHVAMDDENFAVIDSGTGRDLVHLRYSGGRESAGRRDIGAAIVLPRRDGRSSSTAVSQGMCAGASAGLPRLREKVESSVPWRRHYREAMEEMSWFDAPERGHDCAEAGLEALGSIVHFADGRALSEAVIKDPGGDGGGVVVGAGAGGATTGLPFSDRLHQWHKDGMLQPGAHTALSDVIANPALLRAEGITFVCLGAGAELSPARQLLQWGCDVAAVVRPSSKRRAGLLGAAQKGTGRLYLSPEGASDVVDAPERVAGWIAELPGRLVIVDSLYAPGSAFLLAAAGADVVERLVCEVRSDTMLAWIGSPTDAYRLEGEPRAVLGSGALAKTVSGFAAVRRVRPGRIGGVYPGFVDVQGPNYAAAKRIGRWRATVEWEAGRDVSYNVGPMSLTQSVTSNRTLKTAYAGLNQLGMPPLPADASATLMAALLLWDVHHPEAAQHSNTFLTDKAIDCGFFSSPYEPNGLMELAVALGAGGGIASGIKRLL